MPTKNELRLIEAIENKEDISAIIAEGDIDFNYLSKEGRKTFIYMAAKAGNHEVIQTLYERCSIDINTAALESVEADLATPVWIAAANGHSEVIKVLHALGADVNITNRDGYAPVHMAARNGHSAAIEALVACGAHLNIGVEDDFSPIFFAAKNGHSAAVESLAKCGANVNYSTYDYKTPIFIAAYMGSYEIIEILKSFGGDVNLPDMYGVTPICQAVINRDSAVIKTLSSNGANSPEELISSNPEVLEYIGDFDWKTPFVEGVELMKRRAENEKLIRQDVKDIISSKMFDKEVPGTNEVTSVGVVDTNKIIGSFLTPKDLYEVSQVQKPSSTIYQATTKELQEYKEKTESQGLEVTKNFQRKVLDGIDARINGKNNQSR